MERKPILIQIKNKKSLIFLWILFSVLLSVLSACGRKSNAALADKRILVGTNAEYEPFEYLSDEGNLSGFDIELMNEIGHRMKVTIEWVNMDFDALIGSLELGNTEALIAAIAPTKEREKSALLSDVYYSGTQSIVSIKNSYRDLKDLNNKKVAVLEGSISDFLVSGEEKKYGKIKCNQVKRFKRATDAVMELKNGGVDAVLMDTIIGEKMLPDNKNVQLFEIACTSEDSIICVRKGETKLLRKINTALKEIKQDGTYQKIYFKYFSK